MRRLPVAVVLVMLTAACSGGVEEPAPLTDPTTTTTAFTSSAATTAGAPSGTVTDVAAATCSALEIVVDLNALANRAMNDVFAQVAEVGAEADQLFEDLKVGLGDIDPLIEDARAAYDRAAAVAEPDVAADIEVLRDGTLVIWPALRDAIVDAESADAIAIDEVLSDPVVTAAVTSAAAAVLRLDEFTVPECGFRLSN